MALDRDGVAFTPALVQVGLVGVQRAGEILPAAGGEFLPGVCLGVAPDGVEGQPRLPRDGPQAQALVEEAVHDGVPLLEPGGQPPRAGDGRTNDLGSRPLGGLGVTQARVVPTDQAFHGVGEVVPDVPQVGHLDSVRGADVGAVGVTAAAVTANDLHARLLGEPGGEGGRLLLGQKIDRGTGLAIDQHGAVVVCPLRRANSSTPTTRGVAAGGSGKAMTRASKVVLLTGAGQPGGEPLARPAGQGHRDRAQQAPELRCPAPVAHGQPFDLLGERHPAASWRVAEQAANGQFDAHTPPADRAVREAAPVSAVPPH